MKSPLPWNLAACAVLLALGAPVVRGADFPKGSPPFNTHLTTLKAALAAGKKEGKPVIVIYSATWCGPCQEMKKEVYPSRKVKPFHDKFVWAYLDFDADFNRKDEKRNGVEQIPNILLISPGGKIVGQQVGTCTAGEFAGMLSAVLKKIGPAKDSGGR